MKKLIGVVTLLSLCLGCANITLRPITPAEQLGPYRCTEVVSELIADPFRMHGRLFPNKADFVGAVIEWPIVVIDWPFDALIDTVLYPYDRYMFYKDDKKENEQ